MTVYYFAAETGNNANDGLSTGAPKQTPTEALTYLLAGNQIYWKCGERWQFSAGATGWNINAKVLATPCLIGAYGSGNKPIFDGATYYTASDDGNWTHIGSGVWTRTLTNNVYRVFAGHVVADTKNLIWGDPMTRKATAVEVTGELQYDIDNSSGWVITIYTGSTTVAPPSFYGGLCLVGNGVTTAEGIKIRASQNVQMENLIVANSVNCFNWNVESGDAANNAFCVGTDLEAHGVSSQGSGFRAGNNSDTGLWVEDFQLIRPIAHNHSATSEDDDTSTNWGSNNGINFPGQIRRADCVDPTVRGGFRHSMIQFQCSGTTTKYVGEDLHIYRTRSDLGILYSESDYEKPFDGDHNGYLVEGLEIQNQITRSQLGGTGIIRGVRVTSCRQATHAANLNTDQIFWFQNWSSPSYRKVADVVLDECVITDPYGTPVACLEDRTAAGVSAEAGWVAGAVKVQQSLILDRNPGGGRTYSFDHQVQGSPFAAALGDSITKTVFVTALTAPVRHEETTGVFTSRDVNTSAGSYTGTLNSRVATLQASGWEPKGRNRSRRI